MTFEPCVQRLRIEVVEVTRLPGLHGLAILCAERRGRGEREELPLRLAEHVPGLQPHKPRSLLIHIGVVPLGVQDHQAIGGALQHVLQVGGDSVALALRVELRRHILRDHEDARDRPCCITNRTIAIGPVEIGQRALANNGDEFVLEVELCSVLQYGRQLRLQNMPGLRPTVLPGLPHDIRMLVPLERYARIVVQHNHLRPPKQEHRELALQDHIDGAEKGIGPSGDRTKSRSLPRKPADAAGHLAVAIDRSGARS